MHARGLFIHAIYVIECMSTYTYTYVFETGGELAGLLRASYVIRCMSTYTVYVFRV